MNNNILLRINQYEAENYDDYIINILFDMFENTINKDSIIVNFSPYIKMAFKSLYYGILIIKKGYTEGQKLYNLKYVCISKTKLILLIFSKVIIPFIIKKIDEYILISDDPDKHIIKIYKFIILIFKGLELYNYFLFLKDNQFPNIVNRILNLQYTYIDPNKKISLSFNFLIKKVIWDQFSKLFLYFFGISFGRNYLRSLFEQFFSSTKEAISEASDHCQICKNIRTNSTKLLCDHLFCHYCITKYKQLSTLCPICFKKIESEILS